MGRILASALVHHLVSPGSETMEWHVRGGTHLGVAVSSRCTVLGAQWPSQVSSQANRPEGRLRCGRGTGRKDAGRRDRDGDSESDEGGAAGAEWRGEIAYSGERDTLAMTVG